MSGPSSSGRIANEPQEFRHGWLWGCHPWLLQCMVHPDFSPSTSLCETPGECWDALLFFPKGKLKELRTVACTKF